MNFDFKPSKNPNTGEIERVASCTGKLVSISDTPKPNKNNTLFRNATIAIEVADGSTKDFQGIVYENNYSHADSSMVVGGSYLTKITVGADESVLITMSHLTSASSASVADFGLVPSTAQADLEA